MQATQELSNRFPSSRSFRMKAGRADDSPSPLTSLYKFLDIAIAEIGLVVAFIITNLGSMPGTAAGFLALRVSVKNLLLLAFFAFAWSAVFHAFGLYRTENRQINLETIVRLLAAGAAGSSLAILFVVTSRAGAFGHGTTLVFWLIAISSAITIRVLLEGASWILLTHKVIRMGCPQPTLGQKTFG